MTYCKLYEPLLEDATWLDLITAVLVLLKAEGYWKQLQRRGKLVSHLKQVFIN